MLTWVGLLKERDFSLFMITELQWKWVKGWEGEYEICSLGIVRMHPKPYRKARIRYTTGSRDCYGYRKVCLLNKWKSRQAGVHQLVAEAFISNPLNKPFVNHLDGNPANNYVGNLEWVTPSENVEHGYRVLGRTPNRSQLGKKGKYSPKSKPIVQLDMKGEVIKIWECALGAEEHGFNSSHIAAVARGRRGSHKGFIWKYIGNIYLDKH